MHPSPTDDRSQIAAATYRLGKGCEFSVGVTGSSVKSTSATLIFLSSRPDPASFGDSTTGEKTAPSHSSPMRCDHCRKSFGLILHRYFRMRFCSADCLAAYQDRLSDLTMVKIRCLELPPTLPN